MAAMVTAPESVRGKRSTFGDVLRFEREQRGSSYRDVAQHVGVSRDTVQAWEAGTEQPTNVQVKRLIGMFRALRYYVNLLPKELLEAVKKIEPLPTQMTPDTVAPKPPPATFAEALRRARVREGFAQDEIAELLGVSAQAVSAWETDVNTPVVPNWQAMLDLFPELLPFQPKKMKNREKPDGGAGLEREPTRVGSGDSLQHASGVIGSPEDIAFGVVMALAPDARLAVLRRLVKELGGFRSHAEMDEREKRDAAKLDELAQQEARDTRTIVELKDEVRKLRAENETAKQALEVRPSPSLDRTALLRWGRLVASVCSSNDAPLFAGLLNEASAAALTVDEVRDALEDR